MWCLWWCPLVGVGVGGGPGLVFPPLPLPPPLPPPSVVPPPEGGGGGGRREGHAAEIDEGAGRDAVVIGGDIDLDTGHPVVVERGGDGEGAPVTECQRFVAGLRCSHRRSVDHQIPQPQVDGWSLAGRGLRDRDVQAAQRQLAAEEGGAFHEDLAGCGRIVRRDGAPRVRHLHGGCVAGGLPGGRPGRRISRQLGRGRNRDGAVGGHDQHALGRHPRGRISAGRGHGDACGDQCRGQPRPEKPPPHADNLTPGCRLSIGQTPQFHRTFQLISPRCRCCRSRPPAARGG